MELIVSTWYCTKCNRTLRRMHDVGKSPLIGPVTHCGEKSRFEWYSDLAGFAKSVLRDLKYTIAQSVVIR